MKQGKRIVIEADQAQISGQVIKIKNQLIKDNIKPEIQILILLDLVRDICNEHDIDVNFVDENIDEQRSLN
jgi:hypothetical protein